MTYQALESSTSDIGVFDYASMSDLDEAARWAETHGASIGLGEEAYDTDATDALRAFNPRD